MPTPKRPLPMTFAYQLHAFSSREDIPPQPFLLSGAFPVT
eukprot:CAMPEP_0115321424 /NCGR_PEP_ID=MMETSP0270-20121206/80856_1 /TAXON_ID=71861 /ORGANISM="Scrippsiella trochoidea, Strain CCMP3099" /LENGTH=39 /DNA_ID= /DNA_START= /DNA_END= /DNA_ORIENTATION=